MKKIIILFVGMLLSMSCYSWWNAGHMLVANIAYQHLTPKAKEEVHALLSLMHYENNRYQRYDFDENHPNHTMMQVALWADHLKTKPNYLKTSRHWHFIDDPIAEEETTPTVIDKENIIWAINALTNNLKQRDATPAQRARSLAMIIHLIGDVHQPLHNASYYSKQFLSGDEGGNKFLIYYTERDGVVLNNLHKLFDSGVILFPRLGYEYDVSNVNDIEKISSIIIKNHPKASFKKQLSTLDCNIWHKESYQLAKEAYRIPFGSTPSDTYLHHHTDIVEQQIALAGYRLAAWLNNLFVSTNPSVHRS